MRVLVTTGASGGHVFPALSFIRALKDKHEGAETLLVLPRRSREYVALPIGVEVKYVAFTPLSLSPGLKCFMALFKFLKGSAESFFYLLEFRPDVVVGFGTLDTVPLLMLSWMARAKTLIHEQNVSPGRANRFLARFSDRIAVSFDETKAFLKAYGHKVVWTGNPIRESLARVRKDEARDFFGLAKDKFTILVMGGSRGASSINSEFLRAVSCQAHDSRIQVIHITGKNDFDLVRHEYKALRLSSRVFSFLSEMQFAYSACDLVVSRAGATAISEIILFKLPAILVPYSYAGAHQLQNASLLREKGCAVIINDSGSYADMLKNTIESFLSDPSGLEAMRGRFSSIKTLDAADLLVKEALALNLN